MSRPGRKRKQRVSLLIRKQPPSGAERWARDGIITPELAGRIGEHAVEREIADGTAGKVIVLEPKADPIDRLYARKLLTIEEFSAALKLREDFEKTGLDTLRASDWTKPKVDQSGHKKEPLFRQDAVDRFYAAFGCIPFLLKPMAWDVILRMVSLSEADRFIVRGNERDQRTSDVASLKIVLGCLMAHYKIPQSKD